MNGKATTVYKLHTCNYWPDNGLHGVTTNEILMHIQGFEPYAVMHTYVMHGIMPLNPIIYRTLKR